MAMNNSLAEVHPELVSEWLEKNLTLTPDDITFASNKKVWWRGACGYEWQASFIGLYKQPYKRCQKCRISIYFTIIKVVVNKYAKQIDGVCSGNIRPRQHTTSFYETA